MEAFTVATIEAGIDGAAAAAMAGATGYAAATLIDGGYGPSFARGLVVAVIMFTMARLGLGKIPGTCSARRQALLLDDELGELPSESRVVQLFGPKPSSGVVGLRSDRSQGSPGPAAPAGDPDSMVDALHQLRRSLR